MDGIHHKPVVAPNDRVPVREKDIYGLDTTTDVPGNLLASGIYLYRMTAGASDETKRFVILK